MLALLFRHPTPPSGSAVSESRKPLVLRGTMAAAPTEPVAVQPASPEPPRPAVPEPSPPAPAPPARASLDRHEPPPALAHSYPEFSPLASTRWGTSMDFGLLGPEYKTQRARTHTIVDGDTLSALAQRYLGSASRAREIYEANRDVLPSPDVLPIGVELRIPLESNPSAASTASMEPSLVPVVRPTRGR